MISKYVLNEDAAKHIHPRKTWAIGLAIEVGDEIENDGCVFPAKLAHIATSELEPTADIAVGETGPQGPEGPASTIPGPKGDPGGVAGHLAIGEALTGTKNGANKVFNIANTPTGEPAVFYQGQKLALNVDYTRIGTQITLIYIAPNSGDILDSIYPYA